MDIWDGQDREYFASAELDQITYFFCGWLPLRSRVKDAVSEKSVPEPRPLWHEALSHVLGVRPFSVTKSSSFSPALTCVVEDDPQPRQVALDADGRTRE